MTIQAYYRGYVTRRAIAIQYGEMHQDEDAMPVNPEEARAIVMQIRQSLEPFDYEPVPEDDGVVRERRPNTVLDTGAEYEGDWNVEEGKKDGQGIQIWVDGSLYEGYW